MDAPFTVPTVYGTRGMVASADQLATGAGLAALRAGGNAVDAAIAANAVLAVTGPHMCGMGGDLFAIVHRDGEARPSVLNASGRAGSGADPNAVRAEGHTTMPFRSDIRSVTIPGCVDGWMSLHERFGSLPLEQLFAEAITFAEHGFPCSPLLTWSAEAAARGGSTPPFGQPRPSGVVRRPGVAQALRDIATGGRNAWYRGPFGEGLLSLGPDWFAAADLDQAQSDWVEPLHADAFGHRLWTVPPNSQGYLTLAGSALAATLDLPDDPSDGRWAHLLVEAAKAAGRDRPSVLAEEVDGRDLIDRARARRDEIGERATRLGTANSTGDTTYLCTADGDGLSVSLIQSNASGFGSWLWEPNTGVNLHNRGMGFSLTEGGCGELGARRRPPHTLSPALVTTTNGGLRHVLGTMGGDAQPQILLQLIVRLLAHEQRPSVAMAAGRWALSDEGPGFGTWTTPSGPAIAVEDGASADWSIELQRRGHRVQPLRSGDGSFGHAHIISVTGSGVFSGAADPRTVVGSCAGW